MACDSCKSNVVDEAAAVRATAEVAQKYKLLTRAVIALAFGFFIMVGCCIWAVVNAQTIANEAMVQALNTVAEIGVTQETTNTTVTQDTGEGEGNNVYQAGEYASYDEGGVE